MWDPVHSGQSDSVLDLAPRYQPRTGKFTVSGNRPTYSYEYGTSRPELRPRV